MKLGAFSISLTVKDLKASKDFYEKLGFSTLHGCDMEEKYLIMKNGNATIGLFQGMFDSNIITFNPGWDENATKVEPFDDVRDIQSHLKSHGIVLTTEVSTEAAASTGPAHITLEDPDGNKILINQHV